MAKDAGISNVNSKADCWNASEDGLSAAANAVDAKARINVIDASFFIDLTRTRSTTARHGESKATVESERDFK